MRLQRILFPCRQRTMQEAARQRHTNMFLIIVILSAFSDSVQSTWHFSSSPIPPIYLRGGDSGLSNSSDGGPSFARSPRTFESSNVVPRQLSANSASAASVKPVVSWQEESIKFTADLSVTIPSVEDFFWVNHLHLAGLSFPEDPDSKRLFARQDTLTLWGKLNKATFGVFVDGAPGTGKSCSVWAWLCNQALSLQRSFLRIHLVEGMSPVVLRYKDGSLLSAEVHLHDLEAIIDAADTQIVVLDGLTLNVDVDTALRAALFSTKARGKSIRISVSSMGVRLNFKVRRMYTRLGIRFHGMRLWDLEEAQKACCDLQFFGSVAISLGYDEKELAEFKGQSTLTRSLENTIKKAVENKFFFAGGSARWLFEYTISEVKAAVKDALDEVQDVNLLFEKRTGIKNPTCSNTLLVRYPIQSDADDSDVNEGSGHESLFFVSHYVTRTVLQSCSVSSLQIAYELGAKHNNPAFIGWFAEFDFVHQLEHTATCPPAKRSIKLFEVENMSPLTVTVPALIQFSAADLGGMTDVICDSAWLRPENWNQAGYDLVRFEWRKYGGFNLKKRPVLHFLQITRAERHELNLLPFLTLAQTIKSIGMKVDGIEISFILPIFGGRAVRKPTLTLLNEGLLSTFFVGAGPLKWSAGEERQCVKFLGFAALSVHATA